MDAPLAHAAQAMAQGRLAEALRGVQLVDTSPEVKPALTYCLNEGISERLDTLDCPDEALDEPDPSSSSVDQFAPCAPAGRC